MRNEDDCPDCGARHAVRTKLEDQHFRYGREDDAPLLTASVPVRFCCACGFEYTDAAGEDARERAVEAHLKGER